MTLPFTVAQFFGVFAAYNEAIWPAQIFAYGLGLIVVASLWSARKSAPKLILSILALLWATNAIGYQFLYFAAINPAAKAFAAFFLLEALLFALCAATARDVSFPIGRDLRSAAGIGFVAYAMLFYPMLGIWAGHGLTAGPMFGVAPCPTVIFTIGLLLTARGRWIVWLSVVPFLWSLVGFAAALQLGIREDFGLPVAGAALAVAALGPSIGRRKASARLRSAL